MSKKDRRERIKRRKRPVVKHLRYKIRSGEDCIFSKGPKMRGEKPIDKDDCMGYYGMDVTHDEDLNCRYRLVCNICGREAPHSNEELED